MPYFWVPCAIFSVEIPLISLDYRGVGVVRIVFREHRGRSDTVANVNANCDSQATKVSTEVPTKSVHSCVSTSDFQSEVGEVFGEIGGELPAKFGRRFSSFFCWGNSSEAFSTKTPPQISPANFHYEVLGCGESDMWSGFICPVFTYSVPRPGRC